MAEYVVQNKEFVFTSNDEQPNPKITLLIRYFVSNGIDSQVIPEEIEQVEVDQLTAAQLATRQAAVLSALNS